MKPVAFPSCNFAHEYRGTTNLEINLRVWQYNENEYYGAEESSEKDREEVSKRAKTEAKKRPLEPSQKQVEGIQERIEHMEVTPKASPQTQTQTQTQITRRMFVLEWIGMDLIRRHFVNGEKAVQSAVKILRKQFHINDHTESLEIERFMKSVINDGKSPQLCNSKLARSRTKDHRRGGCQQFGRQLQEDCGEVEQKVNLTSVQINYLYLYYVSFYPIVY